MQTIKIQYAFLIILLSLFSVATYAQSSGWEENSYYAVRGESSVVYGDCFQQIVGYDFYRRPVIRWFKNCQRRDWHSYYGSHGGYYWVCNDGNCFWDFRTEVRTWWYFTWVNFVLPC